MGRLEGAGSVRRQLPEYSLSACRSAEGGGGGTRLARSIDEIPDGLPVRGIVSATVGAVRCGLSEPVRPCSCPYQCPCAVFREVVGLVVDAELRTVPDRVRTRRAATGFFEFACESVADKELAARCGASTSASSEAVVLAPMVDSGAGNTSSRTPYGCEARRLTCGEPKNSSYSLGSDDGDGDALCTRDWRRRTKRECASEREDSLRIAFRMANSSPSCANLLSRTIDCMG